VWCRAADAARALRLRGARPGRPGALLARSGAAPRSERRASGGARARRCEVKVIDLGSSCFTTDQLSSYVQSRSYRAPEVILGLPYGPGIDVWSLGCILAELLSGYVLLQARAAPPARAAAPGPVLRRGPPI